MNWDEGMFFRLFPARDTGECPLVPCFYRLISVTLANQTKWFSP